MVNKKELEAQTLEEQTIKSLKKIAYRFAWNFDRSFAKLLLPVLKAYVYDASKSIDLSHLTMPSFIKKRYYNASLSSKLDKKIHDHYLKKSLHYLNSCIDVLQDILDEDTETWKEKWKYKEYFPIEYEKIPVKVNNKIVFNIKIKPEFEKNRKKNTKILSYNNFRFTKCLRWRNKYLCWLVKNLKHLWW